MLIHTGEKAYNCDNRKLRVMQDFMLIHAGGEPYTCEPFQKRVSCNLQSHMSINHSHVVYYTKLAIFIQK